MQPICLVVDSILHCIYCFPFFFCVDTACKEGFLLPAGSPQKDYIYYVKVASVGEGKESFKSTQVSAKVIFMEIWEPESGPNFPSLFNQPLSGCIFIKGIYWQNIFQTSA